MIEKTADFLKLITSGECVYFIYADDVCQGAVSFLEKRGDICEIPAVLTFQNIKDKQALCGVEIKNIDDDSVDKGGIVLVTARWEWQEELCKRLLDMGFARVEKLSENYVFYLLKNLKNRKRGEDPQFLLDKVRNQILKFVPRPALEYLIFNICDHCNLNCMGCDHFACIADPYNVPYEILHNDIERMGEIMEHDYIMQIAVMGGEPLLHPDLFAILRDVRENFPYAVIRLTTNAILLLQQKEEFWKTCRDYNITIVNTKYPIKLDYERIKAKCAEERVEFRFFEGTGDDTVKTTSKKIINLEGTEDTIRRFAECNVSNYGNFVMEGKFYECPFSCQSYRIFNKKFNKKLRMKEDDYLDIYKIKDKQEIFQFTAKPKQYCRYCGDFIRWFEWQRSKKDISEWV